MISLHALAPKPTSNTRIDTHNKVLSIQKNCVHIKNTYNTVILYVFIPPCKSTADSPLNFNLIL